MIIQTGYYKAKGILTQSNPIFICRSISVGMRAYLDAHHHTPKRYLPLAPPYEELLKPMHSGQLTYSGYTELYKELVLSKLDPVRVLEELGPDPILLCYEKPNDFCHRHIVADWFKLAGYRTQEYQYCAPIPAAVQDEWIF